MTTFAFTKNSPKSPLDLRIKNRSYVLFILLFLLSFSALNAQLKVRIYGKISDTEGKALELVSIAVFNSTRGTTTDSKGNYELENGKKDSITIVYSLLGYESQQHTLPCTADLAFPLTLVPISQEMETFEVEENRVSQVRMNTIDAKSTSMVPDASGSGVEALITTLPGVSTTNEMSSQYSVRGGNYDENLIYVNGVEIYRPLLIRSGQQEGLSFINPSMVSNISFSSGGFDARYGDKMSSVLDITYRQPTEFAASVSVGLLGASAHFEDISKNGKFTQLHGIRYKTATYLLNTLDTDAEYNPSFVDYQTQLKYKFNNNWSLSFLGNYSYNQYQFIPESRKTEFGTYQDARELVVYFEGWEDDVFQSITGAASLNYTPNSQVSHKLTFSSFVTNEKEYYDIQGDYWINELGGEVGSEDYGDSVKLIGVGSYQEHARNDLKVYVNSAAVSGTYQLDNHLISWGTTLQFERINDNISEWEYVDSIGYSKNKNATPNFDLYESYSTINAFNSVRLHGFVQDVYDFDKISLSYGLRYNYWSFNNELVFSPRASVVYSPNDDNFFKFSLGRYCQSPFYKEIRDKEGDLNTDIESQKSIHVVLGYDRFFSLFERPFRYTLEAYYKHMTDLIPYDVDNVRIDYYGDNMAKGYAYGIESRVFGEFVPGVDSWVGLTLMKTEEKLDDTDSYVPRPTDQRYNFTMFFQDYFPGNPNYKSHLRLIFGGGLPFGPPNGDKSDMVFRSSPYQRVDWGLSRLIATNKMSDKVLKSLWIDFEVLNLFGIENTNSYFWVSDVSGNQNAVPNYLTGRRFNLKVTAKF